MPAVGDPARRWRGMGAGALFGAGVQRLARFCLVNGIETPIVLAVSPGDWHFDACAYYRPEEGIKICLQKCAQVCGDDDVRNWNWPGSTTDREPYGVIAHELGHHCDWLAGNRKGKYYSEYCEEVMTDSAEPAITSYSFNPAEWFAEVFRLFVTNHALLREIRPKAYDILLRRWKPVGVDDWLLGLGADVPARVVKALKNKMR